MTGRRQERISELLHEQLSILISGELSDPRLADAMVNVTDVVVSPDLRNARVFVEHSLPAEESRHVLAALRHAESFLRHSLAETVNLRYVPELSFCIDSSSARAERVDRLLDSVSNPPGGHDLDITG
jgi:ribosome-binding factor A